MSAESTQIRAMHPYAFRSGDWGTLEGVVDHHRGRRCYVVRFPDGASDFWPVDDPDAGYEFCLGESTNG